MLKQISLLEGYEEVNDYYYISDCGEVYSCMHKRYAKIGDNGHGYRRIGLKMKGVRKWKNAYVHRLVALAYIDNIHNKEEVNHIDENKDNNDVSNLEWCTRKENVNHGTAIDRQKTSRSNKTYVYGYKGDFVGVFKSTSDASKKILGHRNTKSNTRMKNYVFMTKAPTLENFKEIVSKSAYKPVIVKNVVDKTTAVYPSLKHVYRLFNKRINITDYIEKGSLFNGTFKFEWYQVDRIDMPNLHE